MKSTLVVENTIDVESINQEGVGVGHCDGKVVFVDGALPGERVRFTYKRRKSRYDMGILTEVLVSSPDRVVPVCSHFGVCGGCRLQHLSMEAQVLAKEQVVQDTLFHIGKVRPEAWMPAIAGPAWGYRRKARLGVRVVPKKGGVLIGFRERQTSLIAPLTVCHTLEPRIGLQLIPLKHLLETLSCPEQIPQIEYAGGDRSAALIFRHLVPLTEQDQSLLRSFGERAGFSIYVQSHGPESIKSLFDTHRLSYGLTETQTILDFEPTDFVQINGQANNAMVSQALRWLAPDPTWRVLDLFCGLGNFSLPLASRVAWVTGVEGAPSLVERAANNARVNGLNNIDFMAADLDSVDIGSILEVTSFDAAILDPPRTGALGAIESLAHHRVGRLLYVSCNPATLARDAHVLVHQYGYSLVQAGIIDMFPHTHHVETMALFVKGQ